MNLKQQVREAEMRLRLCESKAKTHNEKERCLRQYKIDVLKIKEEEKEVQPMFKDTDKILVHRDGVDYQAEIAPLLGGDLSNYYTKPEADGIFMPLDLRTLPPIP